jgi:hypothetical protein
VIWYPLSLPQLGDQFLWSIPCCLTSYHIQIQLLFHENLSIDALSQCWPVNCLVELVSSNFRKSCFSHLNVSVMNKLSPRHLYEWAVWVWSTDWWPPGVSRLVALVICVSTASKGCACHIEILLHRSTRETMSTKAAIIAPNQHVNSHLVLKAYTGIPRRYCSFGSTSLQ